MTNLKHYILTVFAKSSNQDLFVRGIAEEISIFIDSPKVNFYYGDESAIFTFKCVDTLDCVKEFLEVVFDNDDIQYIIFEHKTDKVSVNLSSNIHKFLFGTENTEDSRNLGVEERDLIYKKFKEFGEKYESSNYLDSEDDEEEDDYLMKIKNTSPPPSLNDILDKINETGMESLTTTELNILQNLSK